MWQRQQCELRRTTALLEKLFSTLACFCTIDWKCFTVPLVASSVSCCSPFTLTLPTFLSFSLSRSLDPPCDTLDSCMATHSGWQIKVALMWHVPFQQLCIMCRFVASAFCLMTPAECGNGMDLLIDIKKVLVRSFPRIQKMM